MGQVAGIQIRALTTNAEYAELVRLQQEIWGYEAPELYPARFFAVASDIGGQVLGAWDGGRLAGYLSALPGLKDTGSAFLFSNMLGVRPEYRNGGLGRLLKLEQRSEALERGLALIEWTFDPLELKNAYFNIDRLGAIIRRYIPDKYGTTSSYLHGGLPTDRCVAEWWIRSSRVEAILAGRALPPAPIQGRIRIPAGVGALRRTDPERAREIQRSAGEQFLNYLQKGLAVIGFERTGADGTYLLGPWESK